MKSGFVAIVGRPNSGKSTLLNQVLGTSLSIVTPKAQTTRDRVLGILTEKEKGQIIFLDTPGIHRAKVGGINEYMMDEAKEALESSPVAIWYIVDPASAAKHEAAVFELLKGAKAPIFLLLNKIDVVRGDQEARLGELETSLLAEMSTLGIAPARVFKIAAKLGTGVEDLLLETWSRLPEGPLYYPDEDQLSDRPTRFFVSEKIREQLLLKLGEEVPYSCAVEIEKFDEKSKPPRIEANIYVERDSQKGIVIGKGAQKIKEIGQDARKEIEAFLGTQVFLGLKVKVLKDWSRDKEFLKRLGYKSA